MKKLTAFIILFSAAALTVSAQKKLYYSQNPKFIEWIDHPTVTPAPPEYANESAIYLLHDVDVNYKYTGRDTSAFYTEHNIVKVLDERGIEMFNTVHIPLNQFAVTEIKARTIDPSGEVHEIDKKMIKYTKDEVGHNMIAIAFEGVERNAEIEYIVRAVSPYDYFNNIPYQYQVPIITARFELSYPKELVMEMKSYNGFPQLQDTLIKSRKRISVTLSDIPALQNEPVSFIGLHRMGVEYRASYILTGNNEKIKLNTWNDKARRIYDTYYGYTQAEKQAVNQFLSDLGVKPHGDEQENIRKIEQGIKTQITKFEVVDYDQRQNAKAYNSVKSISKDDVGYSSPNDLLDTILSKKAATADGYMRLFAACFTQAGVKHEIGLAGDRGEHAFDAKFESWVGLTDYIFYFPNTKKFLDPDNIYLRYPVISDELVGGKGIFCSIPAKGDVTGPLFTIRYITPLPAKETGRKLAASVSFSENMDPTIDLAYSWLGYKATGLRERLPFVRSDKMKDFITSLIPVADKPEDIDKYTISNEGFESYYKNKPLELYASVRPGRLVSKADKQYLFRVGAIMGNQNNLYAEDKRTMPVDLYYPYSQSATITVNIPKGFKVVNPEVVRLSADYVNDNEDVVLSFNSDYKMVKDKKNGDKLVITTSQSVKQLHFTLDEYPRYRKVINTAADFSKVTLLMTDMNRPRYTKKVRKSTSEKAPAKVASVPKVAAPAKPMVKAMPVKAAPVNVAPAKSAKTAPVPRPTPAKATTNVALPPVIKVAPPSGAIKVAPPPAVIKPAPDMPKRK